MLCTKIFYTVIVYNIIIIYVFATNIILIVFCYRSNDNTNNIINILVNIIDNSYAIIEM